MSKPTADDFDVVKKARTRTNYTEAQIAELVRASEDPLYFTEHFVRVQHPLKGAIGFSPYEYQRRMINSFHRNRSTICMTARQLGKTSAASAYLLWKAMFTDDATILIVGNTYKAALEIMERIRYAYENVPDHIRAGVIEYNKESVKFDNGSRIISRATTPNSGRGLAITVLYVDEMSFLHPNLSRDFWTAIRPVLSTGGQCIVTSTPKNDEDQFAQIWKEANQNTDDYGNVLPGGLGRNGFFPIIAPWWEHPERDEAWAAEERANLGEARFRQEMCCEFISDDATLINPLVLARLSGRSPQFFTDTTRWYAEPMPNHTYLVALDPSLGTGRDYAAIEVFQLPEMLQIAEWQHKNATPRAQMRAMLRILVFLDSVLREHPEQLSAPDLYWTFENNSIGEAILQIVEDTGEDRIPGTLVSERRRRGVAGGRRFRKGMMTTNRLKLSGAARLKSLIETGRMQICSANLIHELKNYVATSASFAAKSGEHDDLTSALLLIARMLDVVLNWNLGNDDLREYIEDDELGETEPMAIVL